MTTTRQPAVSSSDATVTKRIRVTRGQVVAAQALVKLRTERGESVEPALLALANATPVRVARQAG